MESHEQLAIPGLEPLLADLAADRPQDSSPLPRAEVVVAENRVVLMELLYRRDGRHKAGHPRRKTYTGLWEQHCLAVGRAIIDPLLALRPCPLVDASGLSISIEVIHE